MRAKFEAGIGATDWAAVMRDLAPLIRTGVEQLKPGGASFDATPFFDAFYAKVPAQYQAQVREAVGDLPTRINSIAGRIENPRRRHHPADQPARPVHRGRPDAPAPDHPRRRFGRAGGDAPEVSRPDEQDRRHAAGTGAGGAGFCRSVFQAPATGGGRDVDAVQVGQKQRKWMYANKPEMAKRWARLPRSPTAQRSRPRRSASPRSRIDWLRSPRRWSRTTRLLRDRDRGGVPPPSPGRSRPWWRRSRWWAPSWSPSPRRSGSAPAPRSPCCCSPMLRGFVMAARSLPATSFWDAFDQISANLERDRARAREDLSALEHTIARGWILSPDPGEPASGRRAGSARGRPTSRCRPPPSTPRSPTTRCPSARPTVAASVPR